MSSNVKTDTPATNRKKGIMFILMAAFFFSLMTVFVRLAGDVPTMQQLFFLIMAGVSAAGGQLSITAAYQNAPARDISVFDYSQIVYAALFGFFLFGEIPDAWSFLGYAIIIGTAFGKWYLMTRQG